MCFTFYKYKCSIMGASHYCETKQSKHRSDGQWCSQINWARQLGFVRTIGKRVSRACRTSHSLCLSSSYFAPTDRYIFEKYSFEIQSCQNNGEEGFTDTPCLSSSYFVLTDRYTFEAKNPLEIQFCQNKRQRGFHGHAMPLFHFASHRATC